MINCVLIRMSRPTDRAGIARVVEEMDRQGYKLSSTYVSWEAEEVSSTREEYLIGIFTRSHWRKVLMLEKM